MLLSLLALATRKRIVSATLGLGVMALGCALIAVAYSWYFKGPQLQFDQWLHTEVAGYGIYVSGFMLLFLRHKNLQNLPRLTVPALVLLGMALHWWSVPIAVQKVSGLRGWPDLLLRSGAASQTLFESHLGPCDGCARGRKVSRQTSTWSKSINPRATSVLISLTRILRPTSRSNSPATSRPSAGGVKVRTQVAVSVRPVTMASKLWPV